MYVYLHMYVCASLFIPLCVGVFPLTCDVNTVFCECDTLVVALYIYTHMNVCVCMYVYICIHVWHIYLSVCMQISEPASIDPSAAHKATEICKGPRHIERM